MTASRPPRLGSASRMARRRRPLLPTLVAIVTLGLALWLFLPTILAGFSSTKGAPPADTASTEAVLQLESLEVVADGDNWDSPPYTRAQFGDGWADLDADGCNTRNEILARDLTQVTYRKGTNDCVVQNGVLDDPYTNTTIVFERGEKTSALIQIDHVVALANAWDAGAWQWSAEERLNFSNDPLNLLAVDGDANQEKGAATFDQWVPANRDIHCEYAARLVAVKYKWDLSVTRSEHDALEKTLMKCPEVTLVQ